MRDLFRAEDSTLFRYRPLHSIEADVLIALRAFFPRGPIKIVCYGRGKSIRGRTDLEDNCMIANYRIVKDISNYCDVCGLGPGEH